VRDKGGQEGRADDEIDDGEWERGRNAADDQIFCPGGIFTKHCIQSHNGSVLSGEFLGLRLSRTHYPHGENKDTNTSQ